MQTAKSTVVLRNTLLLTTDYFAQPAIHGRVEVLHLHGLKFQRTMTNETCGISNSFQRTKEFRILFVLLLVDLHDNDHNVMLKMETN